MVCNSTMFRRKKFFVYDVTVRLCKIYMWSEKKLATYFSKILTWCLLRKSHNIACNKSCTRHLIRFHYPLHYWTSFKDSTKTTTAISCTHPVPHHIVTELQPVPVSIPPPPFHRNIHSSHFRLYSPLLWLWQILDKFWQFFAECYFKSEHWRSQECE